MTYTCCSTARVSQLLTTLQVYFHISTTVMFKLPREYTYSTEGLKSNAKNYNRQSCNSNDRPAIGRKSSYICTSCVTA